MSTSKSQAYTIIEESLDKSRLPERIENCPPDGSTVIFGDMHGSLTKAVAQLFRYCAINNITDSQHQTLLQLEQKSGNQLSKEDLLAFEKIMNEIGVNKKLQIIFTDFIADRGNANEWQYDLYQGGNDYFNFGFSSVLARNNAIKAIPYSNHDQEFLDRYEQGLTFNISRFEKKYDYFFNTLRQLQILIDRGLVDKAKLTAWIEDYVALLRPIYYQQGFIITHSPIGDSEIIKLAHQLHVSSDSNIPFQGANTCKDWERLFFEIISRSGEKFQNHITEKTLHQIHDYNRFNPNQNMLDVVTHNRNRTGLIRNPCFFYISANLAGVEPSNAVTLYSELGQRSCKEGQECAGISKVLIILPEPSIEVSEPTLIESEPCLSVQVDSSVEEINSSALLWQSISDICDSILSAGLRSFIMGAALSFFTHLLKEFAGLEQRKIDLLNGIAGILMLGGMLLDESEESRKILSKIIMGFFLQCILPTMGFQNKLTNVAIATTVTSAAIASSNSDTWASFFSTTAIQSAGTISSYYGYSLGSTLVHSMTNKQQNIPEEANANQRPKPSQRPG